MAEPPGPAVAVRIDVAVLTLDGDPAGLRVLLLRDLDATRGRLPGQVLADADLAETARAVLAAAGVGQPAHVEQLATFGAPAHVSRSRTISISYLALLPAPVPVDGGRWATADDPGELGAGHDEIVAAAVERIRSKLSYSTIAYGLLPEEFTMSELQDVYEAVLGTSLDKRNFRKKVHALSLVAETGRQRRGSHRPAQLYTFATRDLRMLDDVIATA